MSAYSLAQYDKSLLLKIARLVDRLPAQRPLSAAAFQHWNWMCLRVHAKQLGLGPWDTSPSREVLADALITCYNARKNCS